MTTPPDPIRLGEVDARLLLFDRPGMLFGEWFNLGLEFIAGLDPAAKVLCVGSSLTGSPHAVELMVRALDEGCAMAGPDLHGRLERGDIRRLPENRTVYDRVPGVCFMVPGSMRFDPQFRWWYADDDLEMQARRIAPVALVGTDVVYPAEHPLSAVQTEHAAVDRARFVTKWSCPPW